MAWTKEENTAYMAKWRAEHPNYCRELYQRNKEHINRRARKKYRDDEEFRERERARARKYYQNKKLKK